MYRKLQPKLTAMIPYPHCSPTVAQLEQTSYHRAVVKEALWLHLRLGISLLFYFPGLYELSRYISNGQVC